MRLSILSFSSSVQGDGVTALMHAAGEDHADAVEAIWHPAEMSEFGVREKCLGPAQGFSFQCIPKSNLRTVTSRI